MPEYVPRKPDPTDRIRCWYGRVWMRDNNDEWEELKRGPTNPLGTTASPTFLIHRRITSWVPRVQWESEKSNPAPMVNFPDRIPYAGYDSLKSGCEIGPSPEIVGTPAPEWWDESAERTAAIHELLVAIRDVRLQIELN